MRPLFTGVVDEEGVHTVGLVEPPEPGDDHHFLRVEVESAEEATALIRRMNAMHGYEAHLLPEYRLPVFSHVDYGSGRAAEGQTRNFTRCQKYLWPAPRGVDAEFAWAQVPANEAGARVRGADIEFGWVLDHEDFGEAGRICLERGPMCTDDWVQHGTSSVGMAAATRNGRGVTGIAPDLPAVFCYALQPKEVLSEVIHHAVDKLHPGDALLIELEVDSPGKDENNCPIEITGPEYEAIQRATRKGIIVVQPAGNGDMDLDRPMPAGVLTSRRDSGAIMVGAGWPPGDTQRPDRSKSDDSNYGSRVNLQGYGEKVCSTGGGDLQGQMEQRRWYTRDFNGTSSASAMIWGTCLMLQSVVTKYRAPLIPLAMRTLLMATGSRQQPGRSPGPAQNIGPRPDLRGAIEKLRRDGIIP